MMRKETIQTYIKEFKKEAVRLMEASESPIYIVLSVR